MTSQVELLLQELRAGHRLNQMDMLFSLGIGNHTGRICDLRKKLSDEGFPSDYITTEMKTIRKKDGRSTQIAEYFIPQKFLNNKQ
jgi:hypothetical protein